MSSKAHTCHQSKRRLQKEAAFVLVLLLLSVPRHAKAQSFGAVVTDSLTALPIAGVNAILLRGDSTFVSGTATDTAGTFRLKTPPRGDYILRLSMVGYRSLFFNLRSSRKRVSMPADTIRLAANAMLRAATVTATRPDVSILEDTTSFNAEEYKVPEGEALEELLKLLPGVEIDGTNITYNGRAISEFRVNGKDFFKGNRRIALKNLPVELVKRIKAYEKKSDYAEQTGIDDGNEQRVLDIELKKELNETWIANYDAGVGDYGRYLQKLFANRFTDRSRLTLTGTAEDDDAHSNNKSLGADFNANNGKTRKENGRFEIGGHIRGHNNHSHSQSRRSAENYTGTGQTSQFSNSDNYNKNRSAGINGNVRMEWHPDTLTTITANGGLGFSNSRSYSRSRSARFSDDPDTAIPDGDSPLDYVFADSFSAETSPSLYEAIINSNSSSSKGNGDSHSLSLNAMGVRRLNKAGRNTSFDFSMQSGRGKNKNFSISDIRYFRRQPSGSRDFRDQYTLSPSHNWSYTARASYSEPILKGLHLQTSYSFNRSRSNNDHSLYELDSIPSWRENPRPLGSLPLGADTLQTVLNLQNSHYSTYDNYNNSWRLGLNYNSKAINAFAATNINYNTTHLDYRRSYIDTVLTRRLLRFNPSAMFRYRASRNERIELRYDGWSTDPAMTNRIPIVNNSDPLNIHLPGGDLKPAWNNQVRLSYNKYIEKRQQGWDAEAQLSQSSNNISTAIQYDELTGVRTTQPRNINGNWGANANLSFNTGFGNRKAFRLNTSTRLEYENSVGYISTERNADSEKNTTRTTGINQRANLRYHCDFIDARVGGNLRYRHTDNKLRPQANMDIYNYSYFAELRARLPWKTTVESEIRMNSRRGYSSKSANTDELVWDATISQAFFRGSPLIIRLALKDILHNRSNISRTVNAQSRVDSENDNSYSYFMLHIILRLNIFNGKVSSGFKPPRGKRPR